MFRNKSVNTHQFAMIPKAEIPRSSFRTQHAHKTTFDAGYLIPIYLDEVLPGDTYNVNMTAFARLATPLFPIMDNMSMDTFYFFVPNRLVWDNWQKFMGEQTDPGDSTDFLIPTTVINPGGSYPNGYPINSLQDYMGLPTTGQITALVEFEHNTLFLRAYNLIWNEWFRDQNLQDSVSVPRDNGPDNPLLYNLLRRGKRHDYFTSCLPWPQKGDSVPLPLGTSAPIFTDGTLNDPVFVQDNGSPTDVAGLITTGGLLLVGNTGAGSPNLFADLSSATAATINQIRQSFQIQKLLERDARGGTRYTEIVRSHFGVISPDARLQRPEYLGGSGTPVIIKPVQQTSATDATTTPQGNLAATGQLVAHGQGFTQSFTEHGMIIGLLAVRADLTYQQGMRRMWSRSTRYDFYFPVFAMLGEQAVLAKEIYIDGTPTTDELVFGYQERWAEYRYNPSMITGLFRSTAAGTLDAWHLAQRFTSHPTLNADFIQDAPPVARVVAVGSEANGQQFILDTFFDIKKTRPMPMYSVPGLIDHF